MSSSKNSWSSRLKPLMTKLSPYTYPLHVSLSVREDTWRPQITSENQYCPSLHVRAVQNSFQRLARRTRIFEENHTHTPASPLCPNFTPHTAVKVCSRDVNEIVLTTVTDTSHLRASYGGATLFAVGFLQLLCGTALRVVAGRLCSRPSIQKDRLFACFLAATLGRVVLVRAQFFATNFISSFRAVDTSFGSS